MAAVVHSSCCLGGRFLLAWRTSLALDTGFVCNGWRLPSERDPMQAGALLLHGSAVHSGGSVRRPFHAPPGAFEPGPVLAGCPRSLMPRSDSGNTIWQVRWKGNAGKSMNSAKHVVLLGKETHSQRKHVPAVLVLLVSLLFLAPASVAERVSTLQSFSQLSPDELSTTIVRVDYHGPQNESLSALLFTVNGKEVDWNRLRAVPGVEISNWEEQRRTRPSFTVTIDDMKRFIGAVRDTVVAKREEEPWLSLAVVGGKGRESRAFLGWVTRKKAGEFFILMRGALRADPKDITIMNGGANYEAMDALQSFGCALGLLPQEIPAKDVTNSVAVARRGLRFNYQEHRFECSVTLTNISNHAIRAPISLVVDLSPNISLANAHGRTCMTTPVGREFVTIPIPTEQFKSGQTVETILVFAGSEGEDIEFTTKVLATPGER